MSRLSSTLRRTHGPQDGSFLGRARVLSMTLRGARGRNPSTVPHIPIQSPRDQHQSCRNAREGSVQTEGSPKLRRQESGWESYACKVDGAISIVNVHQEENYP